MRRKSAYTMDCSVNPDTDSNFHRRKVVAPLKFRVGLGVRRGVGHFHRRKAVAPLK